jgi:hypothetical protein
MGMVGFWEILVSAKIAAHRPCESLNSFMDRMKLIQGATGRGAAASGWGEVGVRPAFGSGQHAHQMD